VICPRSRSLQAVQYGGRKAFGIVKHIFENSQDPNVRLRCLYVIKSWLNQLRSDASTVFSTALGASPDLEIVEQTLNTIYKGSGVHELMTMFGSLVNHGRGYLVAKFFKAHVEEVGSLITCTVNQY
jgi:hypothetical protein